MTDQEIVDYIRLMLGDIPLETISDATINTFLQMEKLRQDYEHHPERLPLIIYNTLVSCVRWLILQQINSGEATITERLEKVGDETISIKGGSTYQSWKDFLDWLEANPDYVDPSLSGVGRMVIIGGVRQDEFHRVVHDRNSKGIYDVRGIIPPCRHHHHRLRGRCR